MRLVLETMEIRFDAPLSDRQTMFVPAELTIDPDIKMVRSDSDEPLNCRLVPAELLPTRVDAVTEMETEVAGLPPTYTFPRPPTVVMRAAEAK